MRDKVTLTPAQALGCSAMVVGFIVVANLTLLGLAVAAVVFVLRLMGVSI